jgi:hypothetical protein
MGVQHHGSVTEARRYRITAVKDGAKMESDVGEVVDTQRGGAWTLEAAAHESQKAPTEGGDPSHISDSTLTPTPQPFFSWGYHLSSKGGHR